MRPLPLVGLVAGLALAGWGGWCLYARFAGGPEAYWGRDRAAELGEMQATVDSLRAIYAKDEAQMLEYREKVAAMPAGPAKETETRDVDEVGRVLQNREKVLKQHEQLLTVRLGDRDDAKGRALRRGILFTLLGLVWSVRAGTAVFARPRPKPATAAPGPSPPSPRPGG